MRSEVGDQREEKFCASVRLWYAYCAQDTEFVLFVLKAAEGHKHTQLSVLPPHSILGKDLRN